MLDEILKESSVLQAFAEEGREEGRAEGRAEAMRDMARIALEGRLGHLGEDMLAALGTADEAMLRDVVAHVATDDPERLRARLGLGGQS